MDAYMVLDAVANFVRGNTDAAVDSSQTTVSVSDASIFPDPATEGEYNVVIWDASNFPRPDQDGDVEILRVTAIDTGVDELTVTRAQETTAAAAHPSGSAVHLSPTAKMFSDIESEYTASGENFDGEGTSEFSNLKSVNTEEVVGVERYPQTVSEIETALNELGPSNPGVVRPQNGRYQVDPTSVDLTVNEKVYLDLTDVEIDVTADGDVIDINAGGQGPGRVYGGLIDTAGITYTSAAITVHGNGNGLNPGVSSFPEPPVVEAVSGRSDEGSGTGTFLRVVTEGDSIYLQTFKDCATRGYERVVSLEASNGFINGNRFHGFRPWRPYKAVYIDNSTDGVNGNRFTDWITQYQTDFGVPAFDWSGESNAYSGRTFDVGSNTVHSIDSNALNMRLETFCNPSRNLEDNGTNTALLTYGKQSDRNLLAGHSVLDNAGRYHDNRLADSQFGFNAEWYLTDSAGNGSVSYQYDRVRLREPGNSSAEEESEVHNATVEFDPSSTGEVVWDIENVAIDDDANARIVFALTDSPATGFSAGQGNASDFMAARIRGDGTIRTRVKNDGSESSDTSTLSNTYINELEYARFEWDGSSLTSAYNDSYDRELEVGVSLSTNYPTGSPLYLKVAAYDADGTAARNVDFDLVQLAFS